MGGLVGHGGGTITDCYAAGDVSVGSDANNVGGLVGDVCGGKAANCYSVGMVLAGQGGGYLGGLVGDVCGSSTVSSCYFLKRADGGPPDNKTGVSLTDSEMRQQASFAAWDFESIWTICEGRDYPRLRWEEVECGSER